MRNPATPICEQCERLWRDYQRATNEYLRLLQQLRQSGSAAKGAEAEQVLRRLSAAEFNRKAAQQALDAHREETGHP